MISYDKNGNGHTHGAEQRLNFNRPVFDTYIGGSVIVHIMCYYALFYCTLTVNAILKIKINDTCFLSTFVSLI